MSITNQGDIVALRQHLFASIQRLTDKFTPEEINRAKAIADTSQVIINSVKVEADFLRANGGKGGSGFIPLAAPKAGVPAPVPETSGTRVIEQRPGLRVTKHILES